MHKALHSTSHKFEQIRPNIYFKHPQFLQQSYKLQPLKQSQSFFEQH